VSYPMERRLTTILAMDVVGYSRLMGSDEAGTHSALKTLRKDLIEPKTAQYRGRTVKLMGDGALMEFGSVADAVLFAVEVQCAAAARNAALPEERRIVHRIGINLGDIIVEGDDIYGDGVNITARLEALAEPGGIACSAAIFTQITGKIDLTFEALGERQMKNIREPVVIYRVIFDDKAAKLVTPIEVGPPAASAGRPEVEPASAARMAFPLPDRPSIAVLPFANLTGDVTRGYMVDGITDSIITELSRDRTLFVIARNSSFALRDQAVTIARVAEILGVRYVLEGSVQGDAGRLRLNVRLVDALSGSSAWARRFDGEAKDVLAFQDSVSTSVVATLRGYKGAIHQAELRRTVKTGDVNLAAHDNMMRGMSYKEKFTSEAMQTARRYFEKAVELDPDSAEGYAWLAWAHFFDASMGWSANHEVSLNKALEVAEKAVALDPQLDAARWVLGATYGLAGDLDRSLAEFDRVLELNPNNSDVLANMAWTYAFKGQPDQGIEKVQAAIRLNPLYPEWYLWGLGVAYYAAERYQDAADTLKRMTQPNSESLVYLAASYVALGKVDKATEQAAAILALEPDFTVAKFAQRLLSAEPGLRDRLLAGLTAAVLPAG
jgi:TolB-like protein/class 3 adenylate cyclase/cytochrome c-type biogenesis protein CcmH/NrfG